MMRNRIVTAAQRGPRRDVTRWRANRGTSFFRSRKFCPSGKETQQRFKESACSGLVSEVQDVPSRITRGRPRKQRSGEAIKRARTIGRFICREVGS